LLIGESNIRLLYHFEKRLFHEEGEIPFDSVRQVNLPALKGSASREGISFYIVPLGPALKDGACGALGGQV